MLLSSLLEGPKYGYQLKRQAGVLLGEPNLHNNVVYPLLHRFKRAGWVTARATPGQRGQTRFQYALTAAGRRALFARLRSFSAKDAASEDAFLIRVALFPALSAAACLHILAERELALQGTVEHMSRIEREFPVRLNPFAAQVVRLARARTDLELTWIARLRREVEAGHYEQWVFRAPRRDRKPSPEGNSDSTASV
jgi:DNA-binding PadR family transcriptional regulator